jgi:uncharacterized protein (DUF1697 family)
MPKYVAFLRGINLGKRRPPMTQLKALFEELGFEEVSTFIASGNVIFDAAKTESRKLEAKIAAHLESALGYDVETFVRTAGEVCAVGEAAIFPDQEAPENTVHVAFLHEPLDAATAKKLSAIKTEHDAFRVKGTEYYWLCRIRTTDSLVWKLPEMKALRLPSATLRNLTSVRKLIAKHLSEAST